MINSHRCRKCGESFPATGEYFYRANGCFNWACKSCIKRANAEQKRRRLGRVTVERECDFCGTRFVVTERPQNKRRKRFCSYRCHLDCRHSVERSQRLGSKPARRCLHCGAAMLPSMRADARFCSERCNGHAHALVRKHAYRAGTEKHRFCRAELGDRDGWLCQICSRPIDYRLEHPDPRAPSVDHLLPLALGGTNELSNLQLTHLRCNLKKRHYVGDLQLRLVG